MDVLPLSNWEAICALFSSVQVEELLKNQMDPKHFGKQTEKCTTIQNIHKIRPYPWWNSSIPHSKSWLARPTEKQELEAAKRRCTAGDYWLIFPFWLPSVPTCLPAVLGDSMPFFRGAEGENWQYWNTTKCTALMLLSSDSMSATWNQAAQKLPTGPQASGAEVRKWAHQEVKTNIFQTLNKPGLLLQWELIEHQNTLKNLVHKSSFGHWNQEQLHFPELAKHIGPPQQEGQKWFFGGPNAWIPVCKACVVSPAT